MVKASTKKKLNSPKKKKKKAESKSNSRSPNKLRILSKQSGNIISINNK